jgi:hypothetical protein
MQTRGSTVTAASASAMKTLVTSPKVHAGVKSTVSGW